MSKTVSAAGIKAYLEKKNKVQSTVKPEGMNYSYKDSGVKDIIAGTLMLDPLMISEGISKATGNDYSDFQKGAAVYMFVPSKLNRGFFGAAEGITDFIAGGATQIAGAITQDQDVKDAAKWIYKHSWTGEIVSDELVDREIGSDGKGYKIASDVLNGIGNVAFQIVLAYITAGIGNAVGASAAVMKGVQFGSLFASAAGSGTAEAVQKTDELGWRENVSGVLKGGVEVATEMISPTGKKIKGIITGKTTDEALEYIGKHAIAKKLVKNFGEEALEESLSYAGGWVIDNWITKIDNEPFSWKEFFYEGLIGGISGSLFSSPFDISNVRVAQSAGKKVYAKGDAYVTDKLNEGLTTVKMMREKGNNSDNVRLAEKALVELKTNEKLTTGQKHLYMGLAEQAVMRENLMDYARGVAESVVDRVKSGELDAQTLADSINAIVNEAGGEGKYTAADFSDKDSAAVRLYAYTQLMSDFLTPLVGEEEARAFVNDTEMAQEYTGSTEQKTAIRAMKKGERLVFQVGQANGGAYGIVYKNGKDYSVAYTTKKQIAEDGTLLPKHHVKFAEVQSFLADAKDTTTIDEAIAQREAEKAVKAEDEAKKTEAKTEAKSEQTEQKQEAKPSEKKTEAKTENAKAEPKNNKKATSPEDLSEVERKMMPKMDVSREAFTEAEWTQAREAIPNIDNMSRMQQADILTLVRTGVANGVNATYIKGLCRISAAFNIGIRFSDQITSKGFLVRTDRVILINPAHVNETFGHEIWHTIDQDKNGAFRQEVIDKVKKIVGEKAFEKAREQYKTDYRAQFGTDLSDAELDGEATASVVGKYMSSMTSLRKLAHDNPGIASTILAAVRRMKTKWQTAKAFAKENNSTTFAEYRKMTRIERLLMQELAKQDARKAGDTAYSATTAKSDSDGNTLSYGQQKYFARSKVRDASGRLLVVYHGTDADFDTFDLSRAGKNGRAEGFGFYFAANQEITRKYGDKQKKVYLNIEKPLYDNRRTVTKAELRKFVNALVDYHVEEYGDDWSDTFISDYVYTKNVSKAVAVSQMVDKIWSLSATDQDLIFDIANGSGMNYAVDTMEPFYDVLYQSIGYDGNISTWKHEGGTDTIYVTFHPEQAKYVSNFDPTSSTDLRFSPASAENYFPVSPETDSRYLELARDPQKNESELRRLVKEAAEKAGYRFLRRTHKPLNPANNGADYFMFVTDSTTQSLTNYGKHLYVASGEESTNIKELVPAIEKAWVEFADENGYDETLTDNEIDPSDIVMSAGVWDNIDFVGFLFEKGFLDYDIRSIKTNDGLIVFDKDSIKSADPVTYDDKGNVIPLSERFNPQNDDIRYSPASANTSGRVVTQAKPPRQTITEKITNAKGQLNRQGLRNALKEAGSVVEGFKVLTVNAQQAVENQLILMGMSKRQAGAVMQYARSARSHSLNAAQFKLADMTGEIRSDGFLKIIEPYLAKKGEVYDAVDQKTGETQQYTARGGEMAGKLYDEFQDYYAMLHALDRAAVGKNPYSGMSIDEMKAWVAKHEKAHPDFKAAAEKLSAFNSALLDIEAQAGIRSQETVDLWKKQYPHYVPMYVQEDGTIGRAPVRGSRNMEVRRDNAVATESDHRVNDALQNYLNQLQRRIRAAKFNLVLQEVYNSADGVSYEQVGDKKVWSVRYLEIGKDGKEQIVEVGGFKSKKEAQIEYLKHKDSRVNKNVVRADVEEFEAKNLREQERAYLDNPEMENDPVEAFRKVQKGRNTVNEVSFYIDGKRVTMAVSDRIYTGLADLSGVHSSVLDLGVVKFVSKINDIFKKLVTNWNPFFAVRNIARDLQDGLLNSKFGMGEFLNMYRKNAEMMTTGKYSKEWELFVANGCLEASILSDEFNTLAKSGKSGLEQGTGIVGQFQHIKNFNTLTEALPRFTEFCLTLKHGGTIQQAIYNAADVTVNFSRSGVLTRILNKTVSPFLNPAVQGMDRVIRLFTENGIKNNKALASLLVKAVMLAIVPMALSNAMYGGDDEYEDMKDNIKENNYLFKVGDTWLKLPRGRVVSTIAGLYNRSTKELMGKDVDWKDYGKNVLDQITPAQNVARHIASPFVDVANNKTWYGTAIESQSLQNYAVKDRYDENTSRISVWIGQFTSHFGLSPKKVNYLLDQYTGVIGDILLPTTTPAGTKGVVSYNFTVDPNTSSNLSTRFYKLYDETMYASNGGDEEAYYLKKRLDETKSAASELFKQIKTINADSSLSNKEKVKQTSAIRAMINQLYKTALQDAKGYSANIKDAMAIENSYSVEQITQKNAKQYGLTSSDAGKYAVTFGGQVVKLYGNESEANEYSASSVKKTVYAEANRLTYGSEYALKEYSSTVYEKAQKLNELGISYDEYYNYYMNVRYYSGADKKQKILAYLKGSGLSKSQVALMMYYSGYSGYADEAKKAIKASSLSAERKKELLAGITN